MAPQVLAAETGDARMKVVILAGGLGTRMGAETEARPKPMIEIGGRPMLWHIMKIYAHYGYTDFIICLGYKGYVVKEYFANYRLRRYDMTVRLYDGLMDFHGHDAEPWTVTLVDTGEDTLTGGRLRRVRKYLGNEPFMLTYGDGVADVDLRALRQFHEESGRLATVTAVRPAGRFGAINMDDRLIVSSFREKAPIDGAWINGGFFVLQPEVFDSIPHDGMMWEHAPLEALAEQEQLTAFPHTGFWQCMDTQRDRQYLEELWRDGRAPWKMWSEV